MPQDFAMLDNNIMERGTESEIASSGMLSPVSGFSSDTSSFLNGVFTPNVRPAPPFTTAARTNFTSDTRNQQGKKDTKQNGSQPCLPSSKDDDLESPGGHFQDFSTPANGAFSTIILPASPGCDQSYHRQMVFILIAIILGTIVGGVLKYFNVNATAGDWITLPGNLFVRAVECVVGPMVFVNLVVTTADIVHKRIGKRLGIRILLAVPVSIIVAILLGLVTAIFTHSLFITYQKEKSVYSTDAIVGIQCGNDKYLEVGDGGVVTCSATEISRTSQFALGDVNSALKRNEALTGTDITLSDNILNIVKEIVPENIMTAFISNTLLSIAALALPFGVCLAYSFHGPPTLNPLLAFFREVNETLVHMAHSILRFTPLAVFSLLAGSLDTLLDDSIANHPLELIMMMVIAMALGAIVHMFVLVPSVFLVMTRQNPFHFMFYMVPAYIYSLGCSSSMVTLPLSLQCIQASREVPSPIMHFVLSVGTPLHMPGTAIYLVVMVHLMSDVAGIEHAETFGTMLVSFLAVSLCTFTAPPIPSGALLVLPSAWNIVFPEYAIPNKLFTLVAVSDVFLNRFVTICNVNAQAMLCRIIANQVDLNDEESDRSTKADAASC